MGNHLTKVYGYMTKQYYQLEISLRCAMPSKTTAARATSPSINDQSETTNEFKQLCIASYLVSFIRMLTYSTIIYTYIIALAKFIKLIMPRYYCSFHNHYQAYSTISLKYVASYRRKVTKQHQQASLKLSTYLSPLKTSLLKQNHKYSCACIQY